MNAAWIALGLVGVAIAVYLPVVHNDFVYYDDPKYVTENAVVLRGLTWPGIRWAFTTGTDANWFPLTWMTHMLDVQLYGAHAGGHHVTNLVLHVISTLLLFGVLYRMTGAMGRSGFVAGLFALHPLHVESVAWVAERKDVLSTLFWMLTLWAYVWYVRKPQLKRMLLVLLTFALGLMSKPMLVTLPFVLLLLDAWPLNRLSERSIRQLIVEKLPMFALAIASSSNSTNGSVTSIGFDMRPSANVNSTSSIRFSCGLRTYHTYAQSVSIQNKVLNTSFRSATHATDSTCSG